MARVPDMRTTRLIANNTDLAPIEGDLERILRNANPSFRTPIALICMSRDVDDQVGSLGQEL